MEEESDKEGEDHCNVIIELENILGNAYYDRFPFYHWYTFKIDSRIEYIIYIYDYSDFSTYLRKLAAINSVKIVDKVRFTNLQQTFELIDNNLSVNSKT